jgi:hypothetical protein
MRSILDWLCSLPHFRIKLLPTDIKQVRNIQILINTDIFPNENGIVDSREENIQTI